MERLIIDIEKMLNQINTIKKSYDLVAESTGENFNIFQILGMESAEVKTHSKFLAELLNPEGSHGQGSVFLDLFLQCFNIEINEKTEIADVEVEKYIGEKTEKEGGRLDIAITFNNNTFICIENKIYANEQDNQMLRYFNFADKYYENYYLFFLTLDGKNPESSKNEVENLIPISYREDIIEWLEVCKKEAVDFPILREGIGQYINLIKKLTHQTIHKKMEKKISKLILKNYTESEILYKNFEKTVYSLFNEIIENLNKKIKDYLKEKHDKWEIFECERLKNNSHRGKIFIKHKNIEDDFFFGIEEFNPLCKYQHFGYKIFMGILGNWKDPKNIDYGFKDDVVEGITKSNSKNSWINYEFFPLYKGFELKVGNPEFIRFLSEGNENEKNEFVNHLFTHFKEYFEKYQELCFKYYYNKKNKPS